MTAVSMAFHVVFFMEIFAGECGLTMGVQLTHIPCLLPWDSKFGPDYNVLTMGFMLQDIIKAGIVLSAHFGTPCQSMTWARLPQLRSWRFPAGVPNLKDHQQALVSTGNALLQFTVDTCILIHSQGGYFSIENPELSWMWVQACMLILLRVPGVAMVRFLFKAFLVPFTKPTAIVHNIPTLHRLREGVAQWTADCVVLRGQILWKGKKVFRTHLAQAYPPLLCIKYGELLQEAVQLREKAVSENLPVPHADPSHSDGFPAQLNNGAVEDSFAPGLLLTPEEVLVPEGHGIIKGLSHLEHVASAMSKTHPSARSASMSSEMHEAVQYEIDTEASDVDAFRSSLLFDVMHRAETMKSDQQDWADQAVPALRSLVRKIHGPLFLLLLVVSDFSNPHGLVDACQSGFPLVGKLPPCEGASTPWEFTSTLSVAELRSNRLAINDMVIGKLKDLPFSEDILPAVLEDVAEGAMYEPIPLMPGDIHRKSFTRRIPVREERTKGWRTRIVDHGTESQLNDATEPVDKLVFDSVEVLIAMALMFMAADVLPKMWKRDISRAFRRVPVYHGHLDLSWVVWCSLQVMFTSQHRGMPFGTISAVYAWHRIGYALQWILLRHLKAPCGRFVDDFFGVSKDGVYWSAGRCLTVISVVLGFPTDEDKSANDLMTMIVLGTEAVIDWPRRSINTAIDSVKAEKWLKLLLQCLEDSCMQPEVALKFAGRLNFAVCAAGNRVGRAYIAPFYAQGHCPLLGAALSTMLHLSCLWWCQYLRLRPSSSRSAHGPGRPQLITWSDAAGESRWIAAIITVAGKFYWTRMITPDAIWSQLLPRDDNQIGVQEFLALLLALGTFGHWLADALWTAYLDNDGVLFTVRAGGGHCPEIQLALGQFWLALAKMGTDLFAARVESKSNIADGPTRQDLSSLHALGASFVDPVLPPWIYQVWKGPDVNDL